MQYKHILFSGIVLHCLNMVTESHLHVLDDRKLIKSS